RNVTGVKTCALPISALVPHMSQPPPRSLHRSAEPALAPQESSNSYMLPIMSNTPGVPPTHLACDLTGVRLSVAVLQTSLPSGTRSEERRVGKGGRAR